MPTDKTDKEAAEEAAIGMVESMAQGLELIDFSPEARVWFWQILAREALNRAQLTGNAL